MSKQRNFRTKLSFEDEEEEAPVVARPSKDKKKEREKQKKASLLSFGEEEDAGPSIKKKDSSKPSKFHRPDVQPAAAAAPASTYTQRASAGEYSAERLAELQKHTQRIPTSKASGAGSTAAAGDGIIRLQGSFKPAGAPKDDRFTMPPPAALVQPPQQQQQQQQQQAAAADDDGDDDMMLPPPPRPGGKPGAAANGAAPPKVLLHDDEDGEDGMIPDKEAIRLAKAKRERLRQAHLAPDYIPLGGAAALASADFKQSEDAVHSGSDDEQEEHIRMGFLSAGQQQAASAAARRKNYAAALDPDDEAEDFAAAQMSKAIRKNRAGGAAGAAAAAAATATAAAAGQPPGLSAAGQLGAGSALVIPPRGYGELIQQQAAAAAKALQDAMRRMQQSQKQAEQNLQRTTGNLQTALDSITRVEREQSEAGERYTAVQEFRSYLADLLDCLQHKSVIVEELEDRVYELLDDRAQGDREEAQLEQQELLAPADAAIQAAMGVMARGGALPAATAAAEAAASEREEQLLSSAAPTQLDEFGRNVNLMKQREGQERATKRRKLLEAHSQELQHISQGGSYDLSEAASSSSSSTQDGSSRYSLRRKEITEAAATVFADAAEEFGSLRAVKQRLEQFKFRYPSAYQNAYLPLSIPAMLAPYVRLELLSWDPLHSGQPAFDQHAWYEQLFDYGMASEVSAGAAAPSPDDPDLDLVPQLVKKMVLPLVMHLVSRCWLPGSAQQTKVVAALLGDLLVYVPPEDERMVELLALVKGSLEEAVAAATVPRWPLAVTAAYPVAEAVAAVAFKRALQLLQGLGSFEGLLARSWLQPLALGKLLQGQLLPHLRAATGDLPMAVARAEAVVQSLCLEWFAQGAPVAAAGLLEFMSTVALLLEGQRSDSSSLSSKVKRSLVQRLAACMGSVGDDAGRKRLLHAYGIRE